MNNNLNDLIKQLENATNFNTIDTSLNIDLSKLKGKSTNTNTRDARLNIDLSKLKGKSTNANTNTREASLNIDLSKLKGKSTNANTNTREASLNIDLSKLKESVRKEKQESSYNFDKFDINELLLLFKIDEIEEDLNLEKIQHYTNEFINKIPESHGNIRDMLIPSKDKLLNYFIEKNKINSNTVETNNNISLLTVDKDNTFDQGTGVIIPRTQLDNNTAYDAPIKEGKLNPKLENIIQRTLVIDSRYRQFNYYPLNDNSDVNAAAALLNPIINTNPFTIDLEHPISDLLSFKLFSLHIPLVWNNITSTRRNNFFFISKLNEEDLEDFVDDPMEYLARDDNGNLYLNTESDLVCKSNFLPVIIPDNKYSNIGNLITEINNSIKNTIDYYNKEIFPKCTNNSDISNDMITSEDIKFEYNKTNNKIELIIKRGSVKFFTMRNNVKLDYSLGWILGFRNIFYSYNPNKSNNINNENIYTSEAAYDISDTKFVMIYIDDFLQNRINTNIEFTGDSTISAITSSNKNTITDMPIAKDKTNIDAHTKIIKEKPSTKNSDFIYLPMKPRTHTQKEIYAFSQNQIGEKSIEYTFKNSRLKPPVTNNCFALIPIKGTSSNTDENNYPYIDFSGSLQMHERKYFGPVNLRRLKITLVDDKGFVIDLKGLNWSFVIQCGILYQY
jgi:hypothetical protein